jgi:IS5 family transposase
MNQISFAEAEQASKKKLTRRAIFLNDMEQVIPWQTLVKLIRPHYPVAGRGRRPYELESMLRVHLMQNFFTLSDPAMEDALYDKPRMRSFARLSLSAAIPDETTILNFRHLLEENDLAEDILKQVNALLARKGLMFKQGSIMDAESGLVHTVTTTAANEANVEQIADLLHGKEQQVWGDSGYLGAANRVRRNDVQWNIARRPSSIVRMPRARFKGLTKNTAHVVTLFALPNLWMARKKPMAIIGQIRAKPA